MRNMVIGTVAGLLVGMLGALAYTHFLGDGALLGDLQTQLDAANAKLAKINSDRQQLAKQSTGEADQVDALEASNEELKKELAAAKSSPDDQTAAAAPQVTPGQLAGMIMGMMRNGGMRSPEQRMFLLKARLHLTDEQAKQVREALDAENKARRELMRQRFQGGQPDPNAVAAASSLQKTLATILAPDQQTAYQQLQQDEKAARAESMATSTIDQMMPLLQLTDAQKEQAMNALYQQQLAAPDPASMLGNPGAITQLTSQAQSQSAILAKVLNQDQLALYQQEQQVQSQAFADMQSRRQQRAAQNGGNGGAPQPGGPAVTSAVTPGGAPGATPAPNTLTTSTLNTNTSSTNAPAAASSTNSTASTAPPPAGG